MYIEPTPQPSQLRHMTVAIADDHPLFLLGLKDLLSSEPFIRIVGEANSAVSSVDLIASTAPDIALLDLSMPGDIFEAVAKISETAPRTRIIIYTAYCNIDSAVRALEAGASGFILKTSPYEELIEAIVTVSSEHFFVDKKYANSVMNILREHSQVEKIYDAAKLSKRELEIVSHLLQGCTNRQIASKLHLSEKTIKFYMTGLMQKLKARNRVDVVVSARQHAEFLKRQDISLTN